MPLYNPQVPHSLIVPPGAILNPGAAVWPAANRAIYMRFDLGGATPIRYINWSCGVQSGNVQVGIVSIAPTAFTAYTRIAHSGVIACPAAGDIRTDLGSTLYPAGTYAAFLWADNITFQARHSSNSGLTVLRACGIESSLAAGVTATGTITWSSSSLAITVEAG
jgi:hypothetical protein